MTKVCRIGVPQSVYIQEIEDLSYLRDATEFLFQHVYTRPEDFDSILKKDNPILKEKSISYTTRLNKITCNEIKELSERLNITQVQLVYLALADHYGARKAFTGGC